MFARSFCLPVPRDWRTLWASQIRSRARPRREVFHLAEMLRREGVTTGLFSNTDASHLRVLEARGWFEGFFPRIFSFQIGEAKPRLAAFERAEGSLPAAARPPLLVDDSTMNVAMARRVGWRSVRFTSGAGLYRELVRLGFLASRENPPYR
jgi:HAD superfamily hydrolase (TIGR01509 family)